MKLLSDNFSGDGWTRDLSGAVRSWVRESLVRAGVRANLLAGVTPRGRHHRCGGTRGRAQAAAQAQAQSLRLRWRDRGQYAGRIPAQDPLSRARPCRARPLQRRALERR
jgi:hypothetical protein